ncbi:MAG: hypothetical protein IJT08_02935, partial [Alphaproteobacteria bacterium]|nr:hypothetical protein [Alphaproteobacteria bacterium]
MSKEIWKLFFPKGCSHYADLPFVLPSSHAALTLALKGLTAARQIRAFSSPLLGKTIIHIYWSTLFNILNCKNYACNFAASSKSVFNSHVQKIFSLYSEPFG